jgi:hypothetical protein
MASVREPEQVAVLPEGERRAWSLLWEDARRFVALP